jgi:hypothetical protein
LEKKYLGTKDVKKNNNLKLQKFWLPGTTEAQFLIFHVPQKSGFCWV